MSIAMEHNPRIPPSSLGLRLQLAREWRNVPQLEMAEVLDVSRATVSNYERGVTAPSRLQVNAWAAHCDVDVEWIKTGNDAPHGTDPKELRLVTSAGEVTDNVISLHRKAA